jgi:hypothetical protein
MPRDVLLVLVLVAVLLNLALLVGVGIARWRVAGSPPRPRRHAVHHASPDRTRIRPNLSPRARPAAWSPTGVRAAPAMAVRERARPIAAPLGPVAPPAAMFGPDRPSVARTTTPTTTATVDDVRGTAGQARAVEPSASLNGPEPAPAAAPGEPATRRSRRFVLPRNDEDKGRTERAIEAFLGEPAPSGSTSTHRPRRRARRQRPPGEGAGPVVLVAALGGFDQLRQTLGREGAIRFAEAYGEALRATLRSGDHVTDLGQGRLRLVVNADEEGAVALMDRARAVCEPWLRLAPVPLALRVRPMPEARPADARRVDGRSAGSSASGEPGARSNGRAAEAERRRLAAG